MGTKAETWVVRAIIREVRKRGGMAVHLTGGSKQMRGLPDILGGVPNKDGVMTPFFVEVKTQEGEPSPLQRVQIALWRKAGFKTGVVRSWHDLVDVINKD